MAEQSSPAGEIASGYASSGPAVELGAVVIDGVPVLLADVKGDLSGLAEQGAATDKVTARARELADDWCRSGRRSPVPARCCCRRCSA